MNITDPRAYVRYRLEKTTPRLGWSAEAARDPLEHQRLLREELNALLAGVLQWERAPLEIETVSLTQEEGYTREAITFATRPGLRAFAYLLIPDDVPVPLPAIIALPGHGVGADGPVGLYSEPYHSNFALQCVQKGYVTLALEQFSFGKRRDEQAGQVGAGASSCTRDSMAALMLGECMTGWRVFDAMCAVDVLQSRAEVDKGSIATMGISGGGLTSLFTAAMDTRIAACVVSGYFNTFTDSILAMDHCVDNYVPGISRLCEMPDLAALIAPRPFFVENGTRDPIFPLTAFEGAVKQAESIYQAFGALQNLGSEIFEGDHQFHGKEAFAFLRNHLSPIS
jgi:dienelactone hydrolase